MEPEPAPRDVGVVLSGGSINGVMLEAGFLKRLRESALWPRVGWVFGTSAGALSGTMAALDRLDDLEEFLLALQPQEAFRPHPLWRRPLLGLHTYTLPETVQERVGDLADVARDLAAAPIGLVVFVTDLSLETRDGPHPGELAYSSRTTPPEEMAEAILASAAISALVLPLRVGDRVGTDGAWVRNFPLGHAYDHPDVKTIVAFRYVPRFGMVGAIDYAGLRRRLRRFSRVPPVRALLEELDRAEERERSGEPAHLVETIVRLMRLAVARNTALEELVADDKDQSIRELDALRRDLRELVAGHVRSPFARRRLQAAIDDRFAASRFPFRHDRLIPRITVVGSVEDVSLEPGLHTQEPWTEEAKRSLIRRGYDLADQELSGAGFGERPAA